MKTKNKILTTLIPITLVTPLVTSVITLSSCSKTSKDEKVIKPTVKSIELNLKDITSNEEEYDQGNFPLQLINKNASTASLTITSNISNYGIWYRTGTVTSYGTNWEECLTVLGGTSTIEVAPNKAIQFFGWNQTDYTKLSNETEKINFKLTLVDSTNDTSDTKFIWGGSVRSLLSYAKDEDGNPICPASLIDDKWYLQSHVYAVDEVSPYMYRGLFEGSTGLFGIGANALPNTEIAAHCYQNMFKGCTNLKMTPTLPANASVDTGKLLSASCYESMFEGCTSLAVAPVLPARNLSTNSYKNMFKGCSKLNAVNLGYIRNFSTESFSGWLDGVASTGTILYDGYDTEKSVNAIPTGWTKVQRPSVQSELITVEFVADSSSTLLSAKPKFNAFKNEDCTELFSGDNSYVPYQPKTTGDDFAGLFDKDGNQIDEASVSTFADLEKVGTITPKYGWSPILVDTNNITNVAFYTAGTIQNTTSGGATATIQYQEITKEHPQIVEGEWKSFTSETPIAAHTNVVFKNTASDGTFSTSGSKYQSIKITYDSKTVSTPKIHLKGSVKSLLPKAENNTIPYDMALYGAFMSATGITEIDDGYLSYFTTLQPGCYNDMFNGCSNLTNSPAIPVETIPQPYETSSSFYGTCDGMFANCSKLTKVGNIAATVCGYKTNSYGQKCYYSFSNMFNGCSSLKVYKNKTDTSKYQLFLTVPSWETEPSKVYGTPTQNMLYGISKSSSAGASPSAGDKLYYYKG